MVREETREVYGGPQCLGIGNLIEEINTLSEKNLKVIPKVRDTTRVEKKN